MAVFAQAWDAYDLLVADGWKLVDVEPVSVKGGVIMDRRGGVER